jgi:hypothetical protein
MVPRRHHQEILSDTVRRLGEFGAMFGLSEKC